jgi:hypothetical protein
MLAFRFTENTHLQKKKLTETQYFLVMKPVFHLGLM